MWFTSRQFRIDSSDFKNMCRLVSDLNKDSVYDWSLGRIVDWYYGIWGKNKTKNGFFENTTTLWHSYFDELVGFSLTEDGAGDIHFFLKHEYEFLYPEMINKAKSENDEIRTIVNANDFEKGKCLLECGFADNGECETTYVYSIDDVSENGKIVNNEVTLLGMDECKDKDGQVELRRNAFRGNSQLTIDDYFAYEYVKKSPIYDPYMDIVAINKSGQIIAGCEGFIDYQNKIMEIERICTHSQFRGNGLARMVINECIKRGEKKGVKRIQITGWNDTTKSLYSSFGIYKDINRRSFKYKRTN